MHLSDGSDSLHFFYDAQNKPAIVEFNGAAYAYLYNQQDNIIGLVDNAGVQVVSYSYDAWGQIINTTGSLANTLDKLNPFKYRGYIYDEETGLYYLRSRYYNPDLCCFINADDVESMGADGDINGYQLFIYCMNDPVNLKDEAGSWSLPNWAKIAISAAIIIGAAVVATVATGGVACIAAGAAIGAANGAVSGAVGGAITGAIQSRIETGSWDNALEAAVDGAVDGFLGGAVGGFITGGITSKYCFVAGTLIQAEDGLIPIEEIKPDQLVWAEDPETGERALKRVVCLFRNEKYELVHVQVNSETITCTPGHPFYVHGKGWLLAKDLKVHDKLELLDGGEAFVDAISFEKLVNPVRVYNFEVEDFHTYFVGEAKILVHNMCAGSPTSSNKKYGHYEIDYSDGTKYIGKGSEARMNVSARQHMYEDGHRVRSVIRKAWYPSVSNDMAFIDEYNLMKHYHYGTNPYLLNKIQSPGYKKALALRMIVKE